MIYNISDQAGYSNGQEKEKVTANFATVVYINFNKKGPLGDVEDDASKLTMHYHYN